MSNAERIMFGIVLLFGGIAAGMYIEHKRFLREIQGAVKEHAKEPAPPPTSSPTAETAA